MKQFTAGDLTRNTGHLFEAATVAPVAITKHRKSRFLVMSMEGFEALISERGSQVAVDVADMPNDLGRLLTQRTDAMAKPTPKPFHHADPAADLTSALKQISAEIENQPLRNSALARIMRETFHGSDASGAWD